MLKRWKIDWKVNVHFCLTLFFFLSSSGELCSSTSTSISTSICLKRHLFWWCYFSSGIIRCETVLFFLLVFSSSCHWYFSYCIVEIKLRTSFFVINICREYLMWQKRRRRRTSLIIDSIWEWKQIVNVWYLIIRMDWIICLFCQLFRFYRWENIMIITRMFNIRVGLSFFSGWQSSQIFMVLCLMMMMMMMMSNRCSGVYMCFMILDTCRRRFLFVWWRHWSGHWDRIWSDVVTPPLSSSINTEIDREETHTVPLFETQVARGYSIDRISSICKLKSINGRDKYRDIIFQQLEDDKECSS